MFQDIIRCWVKQSPVNPDRLKHDTPGKHILDKQAVLEADFTLHEDANPKSREKGLRRWQMNPERDWGPKPRAHVTEQQTLDNRRTKGIEKSLERKRKAEAV